MSFIATNESYIFLTSFLVSLLTIHVLWQKHQNNNLHWLFLAMLAVAVYNFFALLDASSAALSGRIFWSKLEYLGANSILPFLLLFFLTYPHQRMQLNWKIILAIFILPVASTAAVMSNDLHYLFWTGFAPISGTANGIIFLHGPFYWVTVAYNYLCGLAVIVLIYEDMHRSSGIYRSQSLGMLISSLFPLFASLIYDFGNNPIPGMDILPVGFSLCGLGIVFSIVFLRTFDLIPISRSLLVENLQDGVIVLDSQKRIVDINPAARQLLNAPKEMRVGVSIDQLQEKFASVFNQISAPVEISLDKPAARILLFIPSCLVDESGKPAGYMYVIRDMTEIRAVEQALHLSQQRYQSLIEDVVDVSSIGICILDKDFRMIWVNQATITNWYINQDNLLNTDVRDLLHDYPAKFIENGESLVQEILSSYRSGHFMEKVEFHFIAMDGHPDHWMQYSSKPIQVGYYAGGRIEQFVDITEQKQLQEKIELLAITDELTGIYNRRGLFELGTHDFNRARRTNTQLSLIYFDIDYFKEFNDRFGHAQGDSILIEMVHRVEPCLRDMDTFARYGGDEFVILVPEADTQQTCEIAERINQSISAVPFLIEQQEIILSLSLGIVQFQPQEDFNTLLNRADRAMYRAKQKGRGCVEVDTGSSGV